MKPNGIEKKILEKLNEALVLRRSEIRDILKNAKRDISGLDIIMKNLIQKGMVTEVYASEKTFAITQKGMKSS